MRLRQYLIFELTNHVRCFASDLTRRKRLDSHIDLRIGASEMGVLGATGSDCDLNLLWVQFFRVFSRFEYSLKRSKYAKSNHNTVEVDWEKFANTYKQKYSDARKEESEIDAIKYFKENPPKKQILEKGVLSWEQTKSNFESSNELGEILVLIRRVRNNLFHGGKYPVSPIPESARDDVLLKNSITIIRMVVKYDSSCNEYFKGE